VAAAGSGQRLGAGGPKAFVELCGRPLVEWSLRALGEARTISSIVLAVPAGWEERAEALLRGAAPETPAVVIEGGATRSESVAGAVARIDDDLVAVHDAARPLLEAELVDRVVGRLAADPGADAAIAAALLADTVKRAEAAGEGVGSHGDSGPGRVVQETLDRERLWAAQTPQAFRTAALAEAQRRARESAELESATDEAWLIERVGGRVLIEPSSGPNLKVTAPADLALAAALLAASGRA